MYMKSFQATWTVTVNGTVGMCNKTLINMTGPFFNPFTAVAGENPFLFSAVEMFFYCGLSIYIYSLLACSFTTKIHI